jgi:hypothetical protein
MDGQLRFPQPELEKIRVGLTWKTFLVQEPQTIRLGHGVDIKEGDKWRMRCPRGWNGGIRRVTSFETEAAETWFASMADVIHSPHQAFSGDQWPHTTHRNVLAGMAVCGVAL